MIRGPLILLAYALLWIAVASVAHGGGTVTNWGTTSSGTLTFTQVATCTVATISTDARKAVTINWPCVKEWADKYRAGETKPSDTVAAFSHVMQAIHDGEAQSR